MHQDMHVSLYSIVMVSNLEKAAVMQSRFTERMACELLVNPPPPPNPLR